MALSTRQKGLLKSLIVSGAITLVLAVVLSPGLLSRGGDEPEAETERPRVAWTIPQEPPSDSNGEPATNEVGEPLDSAPVQLLAPASDEDPGAESLDCLIEPSELVDIGSSVTGLLGAVIVERSEFVSAGQVVAELEATVEQEAVQVARARAAMDGVLRAREASVALGERRELASLELSQALAVLDRRTIRSPITGVVVERLMTKGERVDEETILRIAQIDPLSVEVILPSALFGTIEPGDRAAILPEFPGDEVHVASVSLVDRVIDAASGTFGVRLELPNSDHAIPGGLHCQVRFLDE
jgi:multidrug efflux pump subunit AcrA (membrane-fusion protein)